MEMAQKQTYPVVVRTEIDYRRAARLGDRLVIEGWLDRVERARFWCAFRITRPQDNTLIAECRQMLALIEMPTGKLLRLPRHWKHATQPNPPITNANPSRKGSRWRTCAMTTGARTLSIEETLLEPATLPPPPTRHALLVILIALAALLHVVTIGTGDLYSETEGQYAGAAREMVASDNWLLPTNNGIPRLQKPPLLYWLIIASYKILGVNEAAARLPLALAVVATVALIFLIGEKLTDYWRGFIAGLIYLSFCGTFLLARIVMPEPLVTAFMAGAMFCGICGYKRRRHRRLWFAGVWIFTALACLTKGVSASFTPL